MTYFYLSDLKIYFFDHYQGLQIREKFLFIEKFAGFFRILHDQGIKTWKLQIDQINVKVYNSIKERSWDFELINRSNIGSLEQSLSLSLRKKSLITVCAEFVAVTQRSERLRFYKAYWEEDKLPAEIHHNLIVLDKAAVNLARKNWRRQDRCCLKNNKQFAVERRNGFKIYCRHGQNVETILAHLLRNPDHLFAEGESFSRRGAGCASAKIYIENRPYFLKRYDGRTWFYQLKSLFRQSRAHRVWRISWGFINRGLPVPQPILLLEKRRFFLFKHAYLLSEFQEDTHPLMEAWGNWDEGEKIHVLARMAILFGRMHSFGCIHGDTNWGNILVERVGSKKKPVMVDLDCGRITDLWVSRRAVKDLGHFLRDLDRLEPAGGELRRRFVNLWRTVSGFVGTSGV